MRKWLTVGGVCLFATLVMAAAKTRNQYRSLVPGVGVVIDTLCVDADPDTLSISDDLNKKYSVHGAEFRLQTVSWLSGGDRCSLEVYGICNAADTLRDTIVHTASGTLWSDSLTWTKIIALYTHSTSADSTDSVAVLGWATNIDLGTSDVPFEDVHADSFHGHHHGMGDSATHALAADSAAVAANAHALQTKDTTWIKDYSQTIAHDSLEVGRANMSDTMAAWCPWWRDTATVVWNDSSATLPARWRANDNDTAQAVRDNISDSIQAHISDSLSLFLRLTGGSMSGGVDMGDEDITNVERLETDTVIVNNAVSIGLASPSYLLDMMDSVNTASLTAGARLQFINEGAGDTYGWLMYVDSAGTGLKKVLYVSAASVGNENATGIHATVVGRGSGPATVMHLCTDKDRAGNITTLELYPKTLNNGDIYGIRSGPDMWGAGSGDVTASYFSIRDSGTGVHTIYGGECKHNVDSNSKCYFINGFAQNTGTGDAIGGIIQAKADGDGRHTGLIVKAYSDSIEVAEAGQYYAHSSHTMTDSVIGVSFEAWLSNGSATGDAVAGRFYAHGGGQATAIYATTADGTANYSGYFDQGNFYVGGASTFFRNLIVNESGYDLDTRIESDTDTTMIFVDAGANEVHVAGITDLGAYKLQVHGDVIADGYKGDLAGVADTAKYVSVRVGWSGNNIPAWLDTIFCTNLWIEGISTFERNIIVNEGGFSLDTRMESNNDTAMFFLDGSADELHVAGVTDLGAYKLQVHGDMIATSYSGTSDMYNDSAGLFLRRDGTASLTGDLTVDDVDIRGIETVEADTGIFNDCVGIGTESPGRSLHVRKDQNIPTRIRVQNDRAGIGAQAGYEIEVNSAKGGLYLYDDGFEHFAEVVDKLVLWAESSTSGLVLASQSGEIQFYSGGITSGDRKVTIATSGNVGINTTGPDRRFDVLDASAAQIRGTHTDNDKYFDLQATSTGKFQLTSSIDSTHIVGLTQLDSLEVDGGIYDVGVETIVANKSKRQVYLRDAGGDYLVWQNYYWNGSAWVATNGYGFGYQALQSNTGANSSGFGYQALQSNTGASSNGFGNGALYNNTGDYSNGFGNFALRYNTGVNSNGVGSYALRYNTGVNSNGFGYQALQSNTGASSNGVGYAALQYNTGASSNGVGYAALQYNTGAYSNGVGHAALRYNQNDNNIALGHGAWDGFLSNAGGNKTFDHSAVDAATDRITVTTHGFGATNAYKNLQYTEGTDPIGGLTNGSIYQIKVIDANTIGFYEGSRGTNITSTGSGTGHTLTPQYDYTNSIVIGVNQDPSASNQVILGNSSITQTLLRGNVETGGNVTADTIKNNVLQLKRSEVRLWKPEEGACASCGSGVDWYIGAANGTAYQGLDPLPYYLGGSICKLDSVEIVSWKAGVYDSCRVYLGSVNFTGANDADVYLGSITHGNSSSKYRDKFFVNQALNVDKRFYLEFRFYTVSGTEANLEIISTNLIYKSNF